MPIIYKAHPSKRFNIVAKLIVVFIFLLVYNKMAAALARIFGSGKKGEPPSPQQAIQKLRETEEMLSKKSEFLEKKIEKELAAAKKNGMKNKRGEVLKIIIIVYENIILVCIYEKRE